MKDIDAYSFWKRVDLNNKNSLKKLSEELGLNYATIKTQRSNNKMPTACTIFSIAQSLNITTDYLLSGETLKQFPFRITAIAEKLCKVSEKNLAIIEDMVELMPEEKEENLQTKQDA